MDYRLVAAALSIVVVAVTLTVILIARHRAQKKAPTHPKMRKQKQWTAREKPEILTASLSDCLRKMGAGVTVEGAQIQALFGSNDSYRTWGPTSVNGTKSFPLSLTLLLSSHGDGSLIECEMLDNLGWYPRGIDDHDHAEFEQRANEVLAVVRRDARQ